MNQHPRPQGSDSLAERFELLEPLEIVNAEIQRWIISEEEIADDASPGLKSVRRQMKVANDKIREQLKADNGGGIPEKLEFRNQYINVIVGVESNYDLGFEMLKRYNEMGILSDEDLEYRTNSLRTHRLQRVFDGVYTYRPKDEKL